MKKHLSRQLVLLFLLPLLLCALCPRVAAEEEVDTSLPEEYAALLEALPDEVITRLPDGFFSQDGEAVADATRDAFDLSSLLSTLGELVGLHLGDALALLAATLGLLLLSALLRALCAEGGSEGTVRAFSFCASLSLTLSLVRSGSEVLSHVEGYFESLNAISAALLPLSGVLYAMGGNAGAAVASSAGLSVYMTVLEELVGKSILPFCAICLLLALMRAVAPDARTASLGATVKKNYTTALSFLMMLLLAMIAAQTTLASHADTLAMRSVKFAAGSWIPVVGGSLAELLRTVSTGVGYLRGTVGVSGVLFLLLLLLPMLVELFLFRLVWQLSAAVADLLGCERERGLLEEFASLHGYLIAAVAICSSVLLLSLTLLLTTASAIG